MVAVVDVAQNVVAGDGVAAIGEHIGVDVFFVDEDGLFLFEIGTHGEQLRQFVGFLCGCRGFLIVEKGHVASPGGGAFFFDIFAQQVVEILVAQDDLLVADGCKELIVAL